MRMGRSRFNTCRSSRRVITAPRRALREFLADGVHCGIGANLFFANTFCKNPATAVDLVHKQNGKSRRLVVPTTNTWSLALCCLLLAQKPMRSTLPGCAQAGHHINDTKQRKTDTHRGCKYSGDPWHYACTSPLYNDEHDISVLDDKNSKFHARSTAVYSST